jgi:hypothetical protein
MQTSSAVRATGDAAKHPRLHIICDWDVGLFNLILGALAHIYWALDEGRIPIVYYSSRNCYWTPNGYHGRDTVWEYYFEPVIPEYPAGRIPPHVLRWISENTLERSQLGHFVDECAFVSNNGGWHIRADGEVLRGPRGHRPSSAKLRRLASGLIRDYIRPRDYIIEKANRFFDENLAGRYTIGVHIRGTDATGDPGRQAIQTGVNYDKFLSAVRRLRDEHPDALIFIASDEQAAVDWIRNVFTDVIAYDSIRHQCGEAAGRGPAGGIMPAYLTNDPALAAKNGEEAVIEYFLLCRCNYLVHNYSSIPRMVLFTVPNMPDTNIDFADPRTGTFWQRLVARGLYRKQQPSPRVK